MTKRKRTPSPSPPPRKCVMFEVPQSLWKFQAIARELARQSELLHQQIADAQNESSSDNAHQQPASAANFDALTFQNNPLRFSPYSHQPVLPSQPWPQAGKRLSASSADSESNVDHFNAALTMSEVVTAPPEGPARQISVGPEDQLFDELNDALNADEAGTMLGGDSSSQYLREGNRITFDPQLSTNWNEMRPQPYQPITQHYPHMNSHISQPSFSSDSALQSTRINNLTLLPSSPTEPPPPRHPPHFSHPKPSPPIPNIIQTRSNIPGYYKSSLKLWSQAGPHPNTALSRPIHQFSPVNNSYPQIPYVGSTTYPPPAQALGSSPVTNYRNYGSTR